MPKTRVRHKKNSFKKGDLVEYVGRDPLNRGVGIILEEVAESHIWLLDSDEADFSCVRIFWQNLDREETLHKARVKRIADITRIPKDAKS